MQDVLGFFSLIRGAVLPQGGTSTLGGRGGLAPKFASEILVGAPNFASKNIGDKCPKFCPTNFRFDPKIGIFSPIFASCNNRTSQVFPFNWWSWLDLAPHFASKIDVRSSWHGSPPPPWGCSWTALEKFAVILLQLLQYPRNLVKVWKIDRTSSQEVFWEVRLAFGWYRQTLGGGLFQLPGP